MADTEHPDRSATTRPMAEAAMIRRKRRDAALILPLAGAFLFLSPLIDVVAGWGTLRGVPVVVLYVGLAWFGLIAGTWALSRRLGEDDGTP